MKTTWVLNTDNDPLGAARQFLRSLWTIAGLEGMVLPRYQADGASLVPALIASPDDLSQADPFAPLVAVNAAGLAPAIAEQHPGARLGIVLRSCEARAFHLLVEQSHESMRSWLVIGVDCLASFPVVDFEWRVHKAGAVEDLTREALRFARNGGIAPYRYRHACQMCVSPAAQSADLNIELIGLPVKQAALVTARDEDLSRELHLEALTSGMAPPSLTAQRDRVLVRLVQRRQRTLEHMTIVLSAEAPGDLASLLRHISACAPCRSCLQACPLYPGDFDVEPTRAAQRWIQGCVACGMCEEACPRHLPLTAIISRINRHMLEVATPAADAFGIGIAS
jgi:formate dehydrogenase subunit beta